jgi:glycosyltransferase involved in cell wall biosynthesis
MNILFIINSFGTGGAEKQIVSLAKEHYKRGNNVYLVRLKDEPNELLTEVLFMKTTSLKMNTISGCFLSLPNFNKILNEFSPDVVHSHLPHSIVFSRVSKLLVRGRYRLVCTAHNYNIRTKTFGFLYRFTDFISDYNTNVSQSAIDRYIRKGIFSKYKSQYVPNGFPIVDSQQSYNRNEILTELGFNTDGHICCAIGRLDEQKNYVMMLNAFKKVIDKDKSFCLLIMGEGPDRNKLVNLMEELGLSENVKFLGVVSDVYKYLSISDLYLMSSVFEGMPLAICEAMIAGKPMVVTDFKGVQEFVKDYYPIVTQNHDEEFANQIIASKSNDFTNTVIRARKDIIDNYSIDSVVNRWLEIYRK